MAHLNWDQDQDSAFPSEFLWQHLVEPENPFQVQTIQWAMQTKRVRACLPKRSQSSGPAPGQEMLTHVCKYPVQLCSSSLVCFQASQGFLVAPAQGARTQVTKLWGASLALITRYHERVMRLDKHNATIFASSPCTLKSCSPMPLRIGGKACHAGL